MTASVQENKSNTHVNVDKTKQVVHFWHMLPLTKQQMDKQIIFIKHEKM